MKTFLELDERTLADAVVIIDVDGTLTHDKGADLDTGVRDKLWRLAQNSDVYLFSNGLRSRTQTLAHELGLNFLDSSHRKPSSRVAESLMHSHRRRIVIGDKALTDGLFAMNINATFIPVKRIRHTNDSLLIRFGYIVDDLLSYVVHVLFPVLPYLVLMRPKQWVKNLLVFAPLFFAVEAFNANVLLHAFEAMVLFCAASSAVYVFNDMRDIESDRLHPRKRMRPLASGAVSQNTASLILFALVVLTVIGLFILPTVFPALAMYLIGNILYTLFFKHVAVLDLACVAFFYVLRILAGGEATATYVSPWIILCVLFAALFIVIGKRRAEFAHVSKRHVLESYSKEALDYMLAASATLAITSYGLYSVLGNKSGFAVYSTIFVFIAIFRLLNRMYLSDSDAEYPETLVFKDRVVLLSGIAWITYMFVLFYARV